MDNQTEYREMGGQGPAPSPVQPSHEEKKSGFGLGFLLGLIVMGLVALIVALIVVGAVFFGGAKIRQSRAKKMNRIEELIKERYLEQVSQQQLDDGVYKGLMEALDDPYSVYYTKEEFDSMMEDTMGTYYGVGIYLVMDPDTQVVSVVRPIANSPAEEQGVLAGDILVGVNGEDISGMDLTLVVSKIKGEEGTSVVLNFIRDKEKKDITLERRKIDVETVYGEMKEDGIGYLQITEFDDVTYKQFVQKLEELKEQGMKGMILDLRGNPGGNVDTVVKIADEMLPEGLVVYTEDKYGKRNEYNSSASRSFDMPLVLLVDGASASSAEILTGAIRDYGTGTIVGTKTYGKGIVQQIYSLGDGTALKVTVSKYYTPKGENIHKIGISPDIEVPFDAEAYKADKTDNQLQKGLEVLKEKMAK